MLWILLEQEPEFKTTHDRKYRKTKAFWCCCLKSITPESKWCCHIFIWQLCVKFDDGKNQFSWERTFVEFQQNGVLLSACVWVKEVFNESGEAGIVLSSLPSTSDDKLTNRLTWFVGTTSLLTVTVDSKTQKQHCFCFCFFTCVLDFHEKENTSKN